MLIEQQQALLQALWTRPGEESSLAAWVDAPWQRGLAAYRTNAAALAERALLAVYPVVAAPISEESFAPMARQFWFEQPPERGDLACWGQALPDFLANEPQLADVPYLADVAQLEWALHCNASALDAAPFEPASFALLGEIEPDQLTLRLPPGTQVLHSRWPTLSLVNAHLHNEPTFDIVAERIQARVAESTRVWCQGLQPRLAACTQAEAALLEALLAGQSLPAALEAVDVALVGATGGADADSPFDFSAWLTSAVTQGLVLGVVRLPC